MPYAAVRTKSADEWINDHFSGTLLKAKRLGYVWRDMYLEARTAHEWGWEFRIIPRSRVTFGDAYIEPDEPSQVDTCCNMLKNTVRNTTRRAQNTKARRGVAAGAIVNCCFMITLAVTCATNAASGRSARVYTARKQPSDLFCRGMVRW